MPAWQRAASTGAFVNVGTGHEDPRIPVQGSAKIFWDEEALYVGEVLEGRRLQKFARRK